MMLAKVVGVLVASCLGSYLLFPDQQDSFFFMYISCVLVMFSRSYWTRLKGRDSLITLLVCFLFYSAATVLLENRAPFSEIVTYFGSFLLLVNLFIAIIVADESWNERFLDALTVVVQWACALTALICLILYADVHGVYQLLDFVAPFRDSQMRLRGWNEQLENPVVLGVSLGAGVQAAICSAFWGVKRHFGSIVVVIVTVYALLLTGSVSVLIGTVISAAWFFSGADRNWLVPYVWVLVVVSMSLYFTAFFLTSHTFVPSLLAQRLFDAEFNRIARVERGRFDLSDFRAAYNSQDNDIFFVNSQGNLTLQSEDTTTGVVFRSFRVDPRYTYYVNVLARGFEATLDGFYIRIQESRTCSRFISRNSARSHPDVVEADHQVITPVEDFGLAAKWTDYSVSYSPTNGMACAGVLILNWEGVGRQPILVSQLSVESAEHSNLELLDNLVRGFISDMRPLIWGRTMRETLRETPLLGFGMGHRHDITIKNGRRFDHPHSMYLSILYHTGIVGLALFLSLLVALFQLAARLRPTRSSVFSTCLLLFSTSALVFDSGGVLTKMNHVWLVFWLPLGYLLCLHHRQSKAGRSGS